MKERKRVLAAVLAATMVCGLVPTVPQMQVEAAEQEYEIYPTPHSIEYSDGDYIIDETVNVVYEDGIDDETKARFREIAALKDLEVTESDEVVEGKTNILIGTVNNEDTFVDNYVEENVDQADAELFDKTDSYILDSDNGVIAVLGKDNDSSFYGLTTLYHVVKQMESYTIRNFHVEDYADVVSRGFIEGYYGNPWSTEDRVNLMKWGGYYKLNSYFYAPKDDPKHNSNWRELYTEDEIEEKIKPLAEAGNESKCRFVYALHPFMYNAIKFDASAGYVQYQQDLEALQAKFAQVIDAGVRQIAILADDAANVGADNYVKLLEDMTEWIKEKQKEYPDLKLTLPFCVQEYTGYGLEYFSRFPENVQVIMTGGKVWGQVSNDFTNRFTNTVGRGPYMWINWPCTDNSKKHLIMGGYSEFLQPGVNPERIQGIVLNPMQQSEPSKVAIFGNATYSWNIWETEEEADQAWEDSFKYVDHNSAIENDASNALKELSKHMINQAMDSRVVALDESVELKEKLTPFKEKLSGESYTTEEIEEIKTEFEILQNAAQVFRAQAGDENLKEQIVYWLDCWDNTTAAALYYLEALKDYQAGDSSSFISNYSKGQQQFSESKTHGFHYVDHTEYAEVGVQHIVPFITAMDTYLSKKVQEVADPTVVTQTYISNAYTSPSVGAIENALDGNDSTYVQFYNPNYVYKDQYVGVQFNRGITVNSIRFAMGGGKNHFFKSKVQYTTDGENWQDVNGEVYSRPRDSVEPIEVTGLNLENVLGVRLIATEDNNIDSWFLLYSIDVNKQETVTNDPYTVSSVSISSEAKIASGSGALTAVTDGNTKTELWLQNSSGADNLPVNAAVILDLGEEKEIGSVYIAQDTARTSGGDILDEGVVEYSTDNKTWTKFADVEKANEQTVTGKATARYIRVRNTKQVGVWWRVSEISVYAPLETTGKENLYTDAEGTEDFITTMEDGTATLSNGTITLKAGEYIGLDLKEIQKLQDLDVECSGGNVKIEVSKNGVVWDEVESGDLDSVKARFVRLVNKTDDDQEIAIEKFEVTMKVIGELGALVSSDINTVSSWGDTRNDGKAFDGDVSTVTKFGGLPVKGNSVVYSLGQEIDIRSLRIYESDSQVDYIRDAKIQLSTDGKEWTDAFEIGDGVTDTDRTSTFGALGLGEVDSAYPNVRYYGKDDINQKAAYIRILITADYPNRALVMNEIMINGGEYISVETNQAFEGSLEERGHAPSNMIDSDLSTTYKPAAANGNMKYDISDPEGIRTFRIIQNGEASNATVTAEFYEDGETTKTVVGTLAQAINEFVVPEGKKLLSVEVKWGEKIPEISEIILLDMVVTATNKDELQSLINETPEGYDSWTTSSKEEYDAMKAVAEEVNASEYVSQETVDSAVAGLKKAVNNAEVKADLTALQALVNEKLVNDNNVYTAVSFSVYETAIANAQSALADADDVAETEAQKLEMAITDAKAGLVFSIRNREIAETAIKSYDKDLASTYTTQSFANWTASYEKIAALIATDKAATEDADRVNPTEFISATAEYNTAMAGLVNVSALTAVIAEFDQTDASLYTADSFAAYKSAVDSAKALLTNGTDETIKAAVEAIKTAKANLVLVDTDDLQSYIDAAKALKETDYTESSYAVLAAAIKDAEDNIDSADPTEWIEKLQNATNNLVSVVGLKAQVERAESLDKDDYTTSSYKAVADAVAAAKELYKDGTNETVAAGVTAIEDAITALEARAKEMDAYRDAIELKDADAYTADSYAAYKAAYDALMALDNEDTSVAVFENAKAAFEKAQAELVLEGETEEVSTAVLSYALELAKTAKTDGVIESVLNRFNAAYENAQDILDRVKDGDKTVTQKMVDDSWKELIQAMQYLSFKQGNKEDLEKVIMMADQIDLENYLTEGQDAFTDALASAKTTLADGDAMQEDVDSAWKALLTAMSNLRLKPDKSLLQSLVTAAQSLDTTGSSESDVQMLGKALATALSVLENEEATEDEVSTAANELDTAIKNIQASTGETENAEQSKSNTTTSASGSKDTNASGSNASSNATAKSAKTGDMANPAAAMAVFALAAAAIALKRKKEEE